LANIWLGDVIPNSAPGGFGFVQGQFDNPAKGMVLDKRQAKERRND
jgi:hypothetical protein